MDNGEVTEFGGVSRQLAVQSVNSVISPVVFTTIFHSLYIPIPTPISAQLNVVRDAYDTSLACSLADMPQSCIAWVSSRFGVMKVVTLTLPVLSPAMTLVTV